jgi:hypothetical protein
MIARHKRSKLRKREERRSPLHFPWLKFLIGCFLIFFVIFASIAVYFWQLPTKWDQTKDQNIVIVNSKIDLSINEIFLLSYRGKDQHTTLYTIPALENVSVPGGYGQYPLISVRPLMALDKKSAQEVRAGYSQILKMPVDAVWESGDEKTFQSPEFSLRSVNTNFNLKDRFRFEKLINAKSLSTVESTTLDQWGERRLPYDSEVKNCRVALINTTNVPGLGQNMAEILEKAGITVIRLTDASPKVEKSTIVFQENVPSCQTLLPHVQALFPSEIQPQESSTVFERSRSEMEIILGQDIGQFVAKP